MRKRVNVPLDELARCFRLDMCGDQVNVPGVPGHHKVRVVREDGERVDVIVVLSCGEGEAARDGASLHAVERHGRISQGEFGSEAECCIVRPMREWW